MWMRKSNELYRSQICVFLSIQSGNLTKKKRFLKREDWITAMQFTLNFPFLMDLKVSAMCINLNYFQLARVLEESLFPMPPFLLSPEYPKITSCCSYVCFVDDSGGSWSFSSKIQKAATLNSICALVFDLSMWDLCLHSSGRTPYLSPHHQMLCSSLTLHLPVLLNI